MTDRHRPTTLRRGLVPFAMLAALFAAPACKSQTSPADQGTEPTPPRLDQVKPGVHLVYRVDFDESAGARPGEDREAALAKAVGVLRARLDSGEQEGQVFRHGDDIVVELPGRDAEAHAAAKELIARTAELEFKLVDAGSDFMKKLYAHVHGDDEAKELGIEVDIEQWVHSESGEHHIDHYLHAADRAVLERYLAELAAADPSFAPGADREIAYEPRDPDESPDHIADVRTHYLFARAELDEGAVASASVTSSPYTNQPEVDLELGPEGGRRFGELTGANLGHKLAILFAGEVVSAPVIQGRIDGGRLMISMGGSDPKRALRDAQELVRVLRAGSLPVKLQLESEAVIGGAAEPASGE